MTQLVVTDAPQITANEYNLARNAAEVLHKHYPGHLWAVDVQGSVMNIRDINLSGTWGYTLHIPVFYSGSDWDRKVMLAGGELLERFKQKRGSMNELSIFELPTDFAGRRTPEK